MGTHVDDRRWSDSRIRRIEVIGDDQGSVADLGRVAARARLPPRRARRRRALAPPLGRAARRRRAPEGPSRSARSRGRCPERSGSGLPPRPRGLRRRSRRTDPRASPSPPCRSWRGSEGWQRIFIEETPARARTLPVWQCPIGVVMGHFGACPKGTSEDQAGQLREGRRPVADTY